MSLKSLLSTQKPSKLTAQFLNKLASSVFSLNARKLTTVLVGVAVLNLSGCADMSQFAGAVGGAAAEFTCALLELAFACDV